jgi:hypothetical protein
MAHYATLGQNNVVTSVFVGKDENDTPGSWEEYYGAKRTSYNTRAGVYFEPQTGEPAADQSKAFRKNYAGIGYTYDAVRDAFIPLKPFESWMLNEETCLWSAPVPMPDLADNQRADWNELTLSWVVQTL